VALLPNPSEDETSTEGNSAYTDKERGMLKKTEAVESADNPEGHSEDNHGYEAVEQRRALRRRRIFFGGYTRVCTALFGHKILYPGTALQHHVLKARTPFFLRPKRTDIGLNAHSTLKVKALLGRELSQFVEVTSVKMNCSRCL